jgi:hypothetical protein
MTKFEEDRKSNGRGLLELPFFPPKLTGVNDHCSNLRFMQGVTFPLQAQLTSPDKITLRDPDSDILSSPILRTSLG